jgi:hypothetical protein
MTAPTPGELDIEDRANALGSAVPLQTCETCRGKRFIPAPADNAWRRHFLRTDQSALAQNVFVPCPVCYRDTPAAQSSKSETKSSGPTNTPVNRER